MKTKTVLLVLSVNFFTCAAFADKAIVAGIPVPHVHEPVRLTQHANRSLDPKMPVADAADMYSDADKFNDNLF